SVRLQIAVIENELRIDRPRIPVEHGALLRVPGVAPVNRRDGIVLCGIDQNDVGGLVRRRHMILEPNAQQDHVAAVAVPRRILYVSYVSEKMMFRPVCQLADFYVPVARALECSGKGRAQYGPAAPELSHNRESAFVPSPRGRSQLKRFNGEFCGKKISEGAA